MEQIEEDTENQLFDITFDQERASLRVAFTGSTLRRRLVIRRLRKGRSSNALRDLRCGLAPQDLAGFGGHSF